MQKQSIWCKIFQSDHNDLILIISQCAACKCLCFWESVFSSKLEMFKPVSEKNISRLIFTLECIFQIDTNQHQILDSSLNTILSIAFYAICCLITNSFFFFITWIWFLLIHPQGLCSMFHTGRKTSKSNLTFLGEISPQICEEIHKERTV